MSNYVYKDECFARVIRLTYHGAILELDNGETAFGFGINNPVGSTILCEIYREATNERDIRVRLSSSMPFDYVA